MAGGRDAYGLRTSFDRDIVEGMTVSVLVALRASTEATVYSPLRASVEHSNVHDFLLSHVVVRFIDNHPAYEEARGLGLSLEGELCDILVREGENFVVEYDLSEDEWEEIVNDITMNGNMSRVTDRGRKKRKTTTALLLEDAFYDPAVAARVLHSSPGIQTRQKHHPPVARKPKRSRTIKQAVV